MKKANKSATEKVTTSKNSYMVTLFIVNYSLVSLFALDIYKALVTPWFLLQVLYILFIFSIAYSIISIEFPGQREKYVGLCQTAVGIGLLAGPFIGQTIYIGAGYAGTFYAMAGILCAALITVSFLIPNKLNEVGDVLPDEIILEQKESRPSVQAMPIHRIAERASFNVVALARQSARYSRQSKQIEQ